MKIWSTPHGDMGNNVNYNGPKVAPCVVLKTNCSSRELPLNAATR